MFRFPLSYGNEKRMKLLKIQRKNLLSMKMVVDYLNFVFLIDVEAKCKYRIFEFCFSLYQKPEMALWVHGLCTIKDTFKIYNIFPGAIIFLITSSYIEPSAA